ncbi:hypothetical protein [Tissierella praeacuta]|uniref:hypothetical protein n=1 Tax=Tissierella praeacuta TaxID=43131 RepID=UPI001404BFE4|nr:hypothetical protein [Tissierella praeacuta]
MIIDKYLNRKRTHDEFLNIYYLTDFNIAISLQLSAIAISILDILAFASANPYLTSC